MSEFLQVNWTAYATRPAGSAADSNVHARTTAVGLGRFL